MKRALILLLLLVSCVGIYFLLGKKEDSQMSILTAERDFRVKNLAHLDKVIITQRNRKPVVLQRGDANLWMLNNKYLARKNAVDNLLEVIERVQIKYIPERSAIPNIIDEMKTIGVQVDLYDRSNGLIKSYQVGGSTPDERGSYMLMNNSNQPFVTEIPSIEGSVRGRFIMSENDWRDRSLINNESENINYVKVEYAKQVNESFKIKMDADNERLVFDGNDNLLVVDDNKVKAYLSEFDDIYAEYIDNLNPLRDSISNLVPFTTISYGAKSSNLKVIKLYPLSDFLYENAADQKIETLKVEGRYFADCSWGDFMLVQHRLIAKLLRGKSFFVQK